MNISISEKKVFGGATPRLERLKDYRRLGGMTVGIKASLNTWRSLAGSWVKQVCINLEVGNSEVGT